ncbi:replicative DNA helicase [Lyticum sinuosum]|uniref:Replicative DNA helicase n=1 Tax=Lyticum sinuosum TaxID=1332059 RepID=A0AAE4VLQ4_9RICK|nr:replicative DNA helicase [Lyticum sinuosum]MDZ5760933.1 Replicative DNA helicase [Lyticum sinuosum]
MDNNLPYNAEIERELLGAILNNNSYLAKIDGFIEPQHFFLPIHQKIYEIIKLVIDRGYSATALIIKSYFDKEEVFKNIEGGSYTYLTELMVQANLLNDIDSLAKVIYDHYLRRELIDIANNIASYARNCNDVDNQVKICIENAEHRLFNLAIYGKSDDKVFSIKQAVSETITKIHNARTNNKAISGITSGFTDFDSITGGFQPSDLIIIAARPSMGKTSLAINIGLNSAIDFHRNYKEGHISKEQSVAIFSLEMSAEQIANRILAIRTKIDSSCLRMGYIQKDDFEVISREIGNISQLPIYIDDTPAISIFELRARARRLKRQKNISLLIVDYLQLLRGSLSLNYNNRVQEIGEISQGLKAIAKELQIPVIALSQLSRAVESRDDKRPLLSDLRESGNIEQDADLVSFIYREEYYLGRKMNSEKEKNTELQEKMMKIKNTAEVIIAKHRNGPIGTVNLHFDIKTTGFDNLASNNQ